MRILGLTLLASSLVLANSLVVKKGDVEISLNNLTKKMKKGETLSLDYGTSVCFKEGEGRVVVNKRIQLKKPGKCYLVPVPEGFSIKKYAKKLEDAIIVSMIDSTEKPKGGVSIKNIVNLDDGKDIILPKNDKELIIYSDKFGPHPITINLKDEKGSIVFSVMDKNSNITFFKVAASSLKTNYRIEILDGMGGILIDKRIVKE